MNPLIMAAVYTNVLCINPKRMLSVSLTEALGGTKMGGGQHAKARNRAATLNPCKCRSFKVFFNPFSSSVLYVYCRRSSSQIIRGHREHYVDKNDKHFVLGSALTLNKQEDWPSSVNES
ncbi:hypothetical protein NECAME_10119 [Necator americanus]|uniref:Uncharacterized protein n=1 Tax=Necator americanus TaxID=51031 RepID=W2TB63_NECAM|nr:hypothetical protein NECAME_10119 [Necator americanus]ETN78819.1 hypothetical protein NECAME_10119 [Necator americanus]